MKEGSLEAPLRHPLDWTDPAFTDLAAIEAEMRRVFDICHGCRRCFNLCESFPRLFDLIDESESGELDSVDSVGFGPVADACTLCDMCFMTKCPYVPPHEFDLDFPHLMLRYRAAQHARGKVGLMVRQITETDRNGRLAAMLAPVVNWGTALGNWLTRPLMQAIAGIDRRAAIPRFHAKPFTAQARAVEPAINRDAPACGRKAVLYATCFVNYNNPGIGMAARAVLAHNGVETEIVYSGCCGMPKLEHGDLDRVVAQAKKVSAALRPWIEDGYDIIALIPSCSLMFKFEWPLLLPEDADVKRLAQATRDTSEYVVAIAKEEGLAPGLKPMDGGIAVHLACHARAQNMGAKAVEMLRFLPDTEIDVIERCSGHGGSWGMMKENFDTAIKIGRPAARQARDSARAHLASECPLAGVHIVQGMATGEGEKGARDKEMPHPIELMARAYGLLGG